MTTLSTTNNTPDPRQRGFDARLDTLLLNLVTRPDQPQIVARGTSQAQTISTAENPEDFVEETGRTFSRSDFRGGLRLKFAHTREALRAGTSFNRYYRSTNVEVDEEDGSVSIVRTFEDVAVGVTLQSTYRHLAYSIESGRLAFLQSTTATSLRYTDNPTAATPTFSEWATGVSNPIQDVTTVGRIFYVCDGAEIRDSDGGWAAWSTLAAVRIWGLKDRVIASTGTDLYEAATGGADVLLASLATGSSWTHVADGGEFILALASNGYLYAFIFNGTSLELAGQSWFPHDRIEAFAYAYGSLFLVAGGALWVGSLSADGVMQNMQVRWSVEAGVAGADKSIAPLGPLRLVDRDSLYIPSSNTDRVIRYEVDSGGFFVEHNSSAETSSIYDFVQIDDFLYALPSGGTNLLRLERGESPIYTSGGDIWLPYADFFTTEEKVWDSLTVVAEFPTAASYLKVVAFSDPNNTGVDEFTIFLMDDEQMGFSQLNIPPSRYLGLRVFLYGEAILRSIAVHAQSPLDDEVLEFTVNTSDMSARSGRSPVRVEDQGIEVWKALRLLQNQPLEFESYRLGTTWLGKIDEMSTPIPSEVDRGSTTRTTTVRFRGRELMETRDGWAVTAAGPANDVTAGAGWIEVMPLPSSTSTSGHLLIPSDWNSYNLRVWAFWSIDDTADVFGGAAPNSFNYDARIFLTNGDPTTAIVQTGYEFFYEKENFGTIAVTFNNLTSEIDGVTPIDCALQFQSASVSMPIDTFTISDMNVIARATKVS